MEWYKKYKRLSDTYINWNEAARILGFTMPYFRNGELDIESWNKTFKYFIDEEISHIVGYCDHGNLVNIRDDSIVILFELKSGNKFWCHYLKGD